jgi:hypothetical protein
VKTAVFIRKEEQNRIEQSTEEGTGWTTCSCDEGFLDFHDGRDQLYVQSVGREGKAYISYAHIARTVYSPFCSVHAGFLLGFLIYPDVGGIMFLRNVADSPNYIALTLHYHCCENLRYIINLSAPSHLTSYLYIK